MKSFLLKLLKYFSILAVLLLAVFIAVVGFAYSKPSVRFLLSYAGFRQADGCIKEEKFLTIDKYKVSLMVYRHRSKKSDRYYYFQHGHAKEKNKHPTIDRLARSMCDATGMSILIPGFEIAKRRMSFEEAFQWIGKVYQHIVEDYPGRYRAFGSCIGASTLLVALKRVPREIYPEKIFLVGPLYNGKNLLKLYKDKLGSDDEFDIYFKLAITLDSNVFNEDEKKLIEKALMASKPGETDREIIRTTLGNKLFKDILVFEPKHAGLSKIDEKMMFDVIHKRPESKYFIIHSRGDKIIPYYQGKNLADYMKKIGLDTNFLGTELISHTQNQITVSGFVHEARYLVGFFDQLFQGDT